MGAKLAIQPDGRVVVAGRSGSSSTSDFALARYNSDGALDSSFDGDGKLTIPVGNSTDEAYSVLVQSNGKDRSSWRSQIGSNTDFSMVRLNSDGSLDTSFRATGKLTTDIGESDDFASDIAIQSDGKSVVQVTVTTVSISILHCFAITLMARSILPSISMEKLRSRLEVSTMLQEPLPFKVTGKIVLAGSSYNGTLNEIAVVRYNADGSLDTLSMGMAR